ncbi:hypothetical protein RSA31_19895 [Pantoea dispersa]|nr:hypothetical protein NS215_16800 [Pantoea dispersa]KTS86115.1 hypothetical protein RSA31_19895 [Pantoea dispersa]
MSGVNGDVYVAATAKGIGFAGETIVVQGDTVGMARIHFTSSQHRFHLADKMRECHIQLKTFCFAELTGDTGPVSQIVQPVSLLYQTSDKARCHITIQTPLEK